MQRYLIVVALLLGSAGIMSSQPDKSGHDKNKPPQQRQSSPPSTYTYETNCCTVQAPQRPGDEPFRWRTSLSRPEWWLVIVGFITFFVVGWQAILMRQHAGHFKDLAEKTAEAAEAGLESARAALLSAHASVNAERAQLFFIVKKIALRGGPAEFEIRVKNFGRTPARLIGWQAPREVHLVNPDSLPVPPVYEGNYAMENYLLPGDDILIAVFNPFQPLHTAMRVEVARAENVALGSVDSVIYGQVEYLNGIIHDRQKARFCFRFEREPFRNIGGSLEPCGPHEYNYCD